MRGLKRGSGRDTLDIAIVTHDYPPGCGGIGRHASGVARRLVNRGHHVRVICPAGSESTAGERVVRIPASNRSPLRLARTARAIRGVVREEEPDVLFSLHWRNCGIPATLAASGIPLIQDVHGSEIFRYRGRWTEPIWDGLLDKVISRSTTVTVRTAFQKQALHERGIDQTPVEICPGGVDRDRLERPAPEQRAGDGEGGELVLLTVGRVVPRKGHETVLRAVADLVSGGFDLTYLIAGTGPHRPALEGLVSELGVEEHVEFLGYVPEDELSSVYQAADVFVMPNRDAGGDIEGFGLVFVEAWFHGLPVVAGDAHGPPQVVREGEDGFVVDPGDHEAIVDRMQDLSDNALRERLGKNGRSRVETEFTYTAITDRMEGIFQDVIEER